MCPDETYRMISMTYILHFNIKSVGGAKHDDYKTPVLPLNNTMHLWVFLQLLTFEMYVYELYKESSLTKREEEEKDN